MNSFQFAFFNFQFSIFNSPQLRATPSLLLPLSPSLRLPPASTQSPYTFRSSRATLFALVASDRAWLIKRVGISVPSERRMTSSPTWSC